MRYVSSNVRAAICPGAVSSPRLAAANVNADPARSPSTREMIPASPMQMPTMLAFERSSIRSRKCISFRLSVSDRAVGTTLMKSGSNGAMRAYTASRSPVCLKS